MSLIIHYRRMKLILCFFAILALHSHIFLGNSIKPEKHRIKQEKIKAIKISFKATRITKKVKRLTTKFNNFNIGFNPIKKAAIYKFSGDIGIMRSQRLYELISQNTLYPKYFSKLSIHGLVQCNFIYTFSSNSKYLKCIASNQFLRVHTAINVLKSLSQFNFKQTKKNLRLKLSFNYEITSFKKTIFLNTTSSGHYFFHRRNYAALTKGEKVYKGFFKGIMHITNWLTLLEYLPKSEKENGVLLKEFKKLKSNTFWLNESIYF